MHFTNLSKISDYSAPKQIPPELRSHCKAGTVAHPSQVKTLICCLSHSNVFHICLHYHSFAFPDQTKKVYIMADRLTQLQDTINQVGQNKFALRTIITSKNPFTIFSKPNIFATRLESCSSSPRPASSPISTGLALRHPSRTPARRTTRSSSQRSSPERQRTLTRSSNPCPTKTAAKSYRWPVCRSWSSRTGKPLNN